MEQQLKNQVTKHTQQIAEVATASAVIARDIGYMRNEIDKMVQKIDQLSKTFATKESVEHLADRVNSIEIIKDWIIKIIVGSVIVGLLALLGLRG